jgi:prepilin-type N-terminal cleavage/methylation domain-containing protein
MTLTNSKPARRLPQFGGLPARRAFTLMEVLVVVILVGIVMATAAPRVTTIRTQQRVIRAASVVQTDMELAYAIATRNRAPITLTWSSSASAMQLKVTSRDGATTYRTTDFKQLGLSNGDVTVSSSAVTVFPSGFASDTLSMTFSVTVDGKNYKRRVRMSRAGLVKVI